MIINVNSVNKVGFIDIEIDPKLDLIEEIQKLKHEKNAIILAHYYQTPDIQDIADFVGDSLALSQKIVDIESDIIVFAGVRFMAETAKILSPEKKVLLPDTNAGCSLADSCKYEDFIKFLKNYPNYTVVTYVNTTAEIKSLSDICCTSSNAIKIVNSISKDKGIVFAPDKNLGSYIKSVTGRENMVIWDGACHVHEEFSLEAILEIKKINPDAKLIAHPECKKPILLIADFIGSTAELLRFSTNDNSNKYIVATESGIIHQMKKENPDKIFISPPPKATNCGCSECFFMKMITLKKIYLTLKYELPEILLDSDLMSRARKPIQRMIEISK
ncbi:MAG: quinolinate synthase NadA [Bacteroidales bacterium]|nr:MAG: quinolinate synthase NadA [Bacteroidales bacterium]